MSLTFNAHSRRPANLRVKCHIEQLPVVLSMHRKLSSGHMRTNTIITAASWQTVIKGTVKSNHGRFQEFSMLEQFRAKQSLKLHL
jgi:hypothetical protein